MRLYVLGPPRLERKGRPVAIHLKRAQALLVYLATTGRPHSRDALAGLLWPDGADARARLRRTLHYLGSAVGGDLLEVQSDTVGIPQGRLWVDSIAFRSHLEEASQYGESLPPDQRRVDSLQAAVNLYVEDFLAGFALPDSLPFDEWTFHERESLRWLFAQVLERLAEAHPARGECAEAIAAYRRLVVHDPLYEPAHRALMRLYLEAGQQSFALRQYQRLVHVLQSELQAAPDAETTALHDAIRSVRRSGVGAAERRATTRAASWPGTKDEVA